ncbi:MAG: DUF4276 family protein [Candidatus Stygibacter frigidus]|nr:DUF4276 family protein [Candidatus Stygibacter frigidus]
MHFAIFVEDPSGKVALDNIIPILLGDYHTHKITSFHGLGVIPSNLNKVSDPRRRTLLDNIFGILRAFGKMSSHYEQVVMVICDLDNKCLKEFRNELLDILNKCNQKPDTIFCLAIEEGEAWLLGDIEAIRKAYPKVKSNILSNYINDSICGTWETLADAICKGGSQALKKKGYPAVGKEKSDWAKNITPYMDFHRNKSPSFNYFITKIQEYLSVDPN